MNTDLEDALRQLKFAADGACVAATEFTLHPSADRLWEAWASQSDATNALIRADALYRAATAPP